MHKLKQAAYGAATSALMLMPTVAGAQVNTGGGWDAGFDNAGSGGTPGGSIFDIINTTMLWLLGILGFIAIIGFVIAGILYLTAAGDETQIEKAKTAMTYSIIGIIVALLGFVITQAVTTWLNAGTGGGGTAF